MNIHVFYVLVAGLLHGSQNDNLGNYLISMHSPLHQSADPYLPSFTHISQAFTIFSINASTVYALNYISPFLYNIAISEKQRSESKTGYEI